VPDEQPPLDDLDLPRCCCWWRRRAEDRSVALPSSDSLALADSSPLRYDHDAGDSPFGLLDRG
jgi:hypothetical protein